MGLKLPAANLGEPQLVRPELAWLFRPSIFVSNTSPGLTGPSDLTFCGIAVPILVQRRWPNRAGESLDIVTFSTHIALPARAQMLSWIDLSECEMTLVRSAARIARATQLRNLAVDLVALRGALADAKDGDKTIQVMTFEGDRLSVLYKTPRVPLSTGCAPAQFRPKDFMVDVWFDGRKTMSVQWDHEEPVEVVAFKPGEWEDSIAKALSD